MRNQRRLTFTTLKRVIEDTDTPAGRAFDLLVYFLIVLSLVSFSVETIPDLSATVTRSMEAIELVTVLLFTMEYFLRLLVSTPKRKYLFSFYGIVDLVAILPFFLGVGVDARTVRVLRLLRLFRVLKLARYSSAIQRYHRALSIAKEELVLFLVVTAILLYLAAVGIYYCESDVQPEKFGSVFHCLWWAVATLSTVGYGDVYPITIGGKVFTTFVLLIGLGVISVPAGLLASALAKARRLEDDDRESKDKGSEHADE